MLLRYTFKLYEAIAAKFKLDGYRKHCKNTKGQKHHHSSEGDGPVRKDTFR